ncbi:MAG: hypothetical protein SOZ80_00415 [Prevotella sp.]|uniref:hypothetical protein n=1 Tax=Prevotella sp. TaxID=59823 RepID=UPI002A2ABA60|nr:hypothetical protein [Prevotella sp.]MDD7318857.1 hypothetical protein [Prevotellaceae bacterium]MDY4019234.1 hypothetical protein [Prevotella sp.]
MKKITFAILIMAITLAARAQSGTNSPYSQYGFGVLAEQTSGFNRGMNGLGIGFRYNNQVNYINPASYSAMDSLTFIFDAGVSGQLTNFSENGVKKNAKNANFEYAVAAFRMFKNAGLSFGILPFSNVGYNYTSSGYMNRDKTSGYVNTYLGDGGVHQVYLGFGVEPLKNISIGVNASYLWGEYNRYIVNSYTDVYINSLSKHYSTDVRSYRLDFGMQYTLPIGKANTLTLGATYGLGHKLNADAECRILSTNSQTGVKDSTTFIVKNGLEIPHFIGAGFMFNHKNKMRVGIDYSLQKWGSTSFPVYSDNGGRASYSLNDKYFKDRHKITVGGEYCPSITSRRFLSRISYRFGASYTTPYLDINGEDGPKEFSVSAGFGIPIINGYNNKSLLNISAQWVRTDSKRFITENTFRINIGLTFNERWFMKWKVE